MLSGKQTSLLPRPQESAEVEVGIDFGVRSGCYRRDTLSGSDDGRGSALALTASFRRKKRRRVDSWVMS